METENLKSIKNHTSVWGCVFVLMSLILLYLLCISIILSDKLTEKDFEFLYYSVKIYNKIFPWLFGLVFFLSFGSNIITFLKSKNIINE